MTRTDTDVGVSLSSLPVHLLANPLRDRARSVRQTHDLGPAVAVTTGKREKRLRVEEVSMAPGRDLPIVYAEDLLDLVLAKVSRPDQQEHDRSFPGDCCRMPQAGCVAVTVGR
jgi:hypothetical protein